MAIDPLCDMDVDEPSSKWTSARRDKRSLCARGRKNRFDKEPEEFLNK